MVYEPKINGHWGVQGTGTFLNSSINVKNQPFTREMGKFRSSELLRGVLRIDSNRILEIKRVQKSGTPHLKFGTSFIAIWAKEKLQGFGPQTFENQYQCPITFSLITLIWITRKLDFETSFSRLIRSLSKGLMVCKKGRWYQAKNHPVIRFVFFGY